MVDSVQYQVLGALSAWSNGGAVGLGGPRQRLVLALLLIQSGEAVSVDRLIDGIWGDGQPEQARHTLQAYISELRRVLDDPIEWTGHGYRIDVSADRVDARRFERLAGEGRAALDRDPYTAASLLQQGLDLWHGDPFADLAYAEGLQSEIRRLKQLRLVALEDRIEADLAVGSHRLVVEELEVLTREHPLDERLAGQLMLALYRSGRQVEAVRAFDRVRASLVDEMGLEPSRDLQQLLQRILEQDEDLITPLSDDQRASVPGPADFVRGLELRETIGEGQAGVVYRAYQPSVGREVAVKKIKTDAANSSAFIRRFESETQAISRFEHPHILSLYDFWRDSGGTYLVMPLMEGGSLDDRVEDGPLPLPTAMKLLEGVGSALAYAHRRGVIHGNVKPSNVLIDAEGNFYLSDFFRGHGASAPVGSFEQRLGLQVTERTDILQLGVLAGRVLATGDDLTAGVDDVVARALSEDPDERFSRVDEFLRALRRAMGADVVGLAGTGPVDEPVRNPYKGLRAFQEADAADFFGREDALANLLEAVRTHSLVAVVGPSGSGKSSLVRAGLIPALRKGAVEGSEDWLITDMFPGAYPFEELLSALRRIASAPEDPSFEDLTRDPRGLVRTVKRILPDERAGILLVVDQFEEVFSMVTDSETRTLFLDSLVEATQASGGRVRTLVTFRADFYDRPLEYHRFGELVESGLVTLGMPSPEGLARAISGPAHNADLDLQPGLAAEIVHDVERQPGGLPLFQHALAELFDEREERLLTVAGYRRTGGVLGALGKRAEELYRSLGDSERAAAEQIFLRLVSVDETSEDTRRRVRRGELTALDFPAPVLDSVLQSFGGYRLLSFDHDPITREPTVEVAHEALLTKWERLRGWIDDRRHDLVIRRRLQAALRDFDDSDGAPGFLLGEGRLQHFESWAADSTLDLTGPEREFLTSSRREEDARRVRSRRRRRGVIVGLSGVALVAVVLATLFLIQRNRAELGERTAQVQRLAASARLNVEQDPDLALLLAAEAVEASDGLSGDAGWEALSTIHAVLLARRPPRAIDGGGNVVWIPGVAEEGRAAAPLLVSHEPVPGGTSSYIWNPATGVRIGTLEGPGPSIGLDISGDGTRVATAHRDGPVAIWEREGVEAVQVALVGDNPAGYDFVGLTEDGTTLIAGEVPPDLGYSQAIAVFDVATGEQIHSLDYTENRAEDMALSADGSTFAVAERGTGIVRLFETSSWIELDAPDATASGVALSKDGAWLATATGDRIDLWNTSTGARRSSIEVSLGDVFAMEWAPDAGSIAIGSPTGRIMIYDAGTGEEVASLVGHDHPPHSLSFSPDGRYLASTIVDVPPVVLVWDLAQPAGEELMTYFGDPTKAVTHATWTVDEERVLASSFDYGNTTIFDTDTARVLATYPNEVGVAERARALPSPDGRFIAAGNHLVEFEGPGSARVVDADTLELVTSLRGSIPMAYSADSSLLVVGDFDIGYVYEVGTWEPVATLLDPESRTAINDIYTDGHFLSDGRHFLTADAGLRPGAAIWDMDSWSVVGTVPLGEETAYLSAGGGLIAVARQFDGRVAIYREEDILEDVTVEAAPYWEIVGGDQLLFASLSPDGSLLVTGGFDEHITFWDVPARERLYSIDMGMLPSDVEFSEDGRHILVALYGITRLLTLDPGELVELARDRAARELTEEECRFYLTDPCPPAG